MSEVQASEQAQRLLQRTSFCGYENGELVKNDACFYTSESWQLSEQWMGVEALQFKKKKSLPGG